MTHLDLPTLDSAFAVALALKATLLVACAGLASVAMARLRASAATRHLVWTLAVVGLLALPLASVALPGWRVGILPALASGTLPAAVDVSVDASAPAAEMHAAAASGISLAASEASPPIVVSRWSDALREIGWGRAAVLVYLAGALLLLARMAAGQWGVRRLARQAEPVADPAWTGLLSELSWMLEVGRPVRLLWSVRATMPMTWGFRRPVVLIPAEADAWPQERRRVVLLHELAHVARHDCLTQALAEAARALYWPHPGAWYAARRLRVERELACDDRVLAAGTRPKTYAAHLLEVARAFRAPPLAAAAAVSMARPSQLEGRLLAVLDTVRSRRAPTRRTSLAAGAAAAALVLPLALLQPEKAGAAETSATWDGASAQDSVFERRLPARSGGSLQVVVETGATVRVEGWDRDELHVRAVQSGPDRHRLRVSVEGDGREFEVASRLDGEGDVRQEMVVHVPRRFDVSVRSEGGSVRVTGVSGELRGNTDGGRLVLVNAAGTARFSTGGGNAEVRDSRLSGNIEAGGGTVTMARNRGDLNVDGISVAPAETAVTTTVPTRAAGAVETVVVPATAGEAVSVGVGPAVAGRAVTVTPCRGGGCGVASEAVTITTTTATPVAAGRAASACGGEGCVAATAGSGASAGATRAVAGRAAASGAVTTITTTTATPVAAGRAVTVTPCRGGECESVASEALTTTVPTARAGRAVSVAPCRGGECVAVAGGVAVTAARAEGVATMTTTTPTTAAGRGKPRTAPVAAVAESVEGTAGVRGSSRTAVATAQQKSYNGYAEAFYDIVMTAPQAGVRANALESLVSNASDAALERLVAISRRHPDANTRRMALEALGRRGNRAALPALEWSAFNDPSQEVQLAALEAFIMTLDLPAPEEVLARLEKIERTHPSAVVRTRAADVKNRPILRRQLP